MQNHFEVFSETLKGFSIFNSGLKPGVLITDSMRFGGIFDGVGENPWPAAWQA